MKHLKLYIIMTNVIIFQVKLQRFIHPFVFAIGDMIKNIVGQVIYLPNNLLIFKFN